MSTTTSATPAPLQAKEAGDASVRQVTLSKRDKKYDRQLRLWAASGQDALENAHVLLLNSGTGVVGIEALKNLILPGVGNFTIVDDANVQEKDLGLNFFLTEDSLGKARVQETTQYLQELNPEVAGNGIKMSTEKFLSLPDNLSPYTLIMLVGPVKPALLESLSLYSSQYSIPLFYMHSIGFYSHFSVQLPAHFPCVDTHPEPESVEDLRLLKPWPELTNFMQVKTHDIETVSDHEHGHIPYVLLLLYHLDVWKASHDGVPPQNYSEKKQFKSLIEHGARKSGAEGAGENFEEAMNAVNKSINPPQISSGLRAIFEAEECKVPTAETPNFWVIAHAIRDFYSKYDVLPLPGALPDMKAQSADYIQLQNIYKAKARKDLAEIIDKVRALESELMKDKSIDEREIEAFCKAAASVKLMEGRPLQIPQASENMDWAERAKSLCQELIVFEDDEKPPATPVLCLYIAFLAYDYTMAEYSGIKGEASIETEQMASYCKHTIERLQSHTGIEMNMELTFSMMEKVVAELQRAEGGELHNISALTGGMVAQEVIKIITKQYIPFDNTCVFDGIDAQRAGAFAFFTVPERIDSFLGLQNGGSIVAETTGNRSHNLTSAAASGISAVQGASTASAGQVAGTEATEGSLFTYVLFQQLRSFGGVFNYLLSKWAFACLVLAIVLNRTKAYASGRRRVYLTWPLRLALRTIPIMLLVMHAISFLQAIRCQSSHSYSILRYGTEDKNLGLDFSGDSRSLYKLSSTLLFWQDDQQSCLAVSMIRPDRDGAAPIGSLSLLWPFFKSLCVSQFVETLSFVVQGLTPVTETGMSVFEHSLAFAEAEGVVTKQLGISPWGFPKRQTHDTNSNAPESATTLDNATLKLLYDRVNTPPEVLLMAFISSLNSLSAHVLAVFGLKRRFRLINTGVWGLCFIGALLGGLLNLNLEADIDAIILRFPTVCIVGFVPHLLILVGITLCASIYLLAITLAVLSPPIGLPQPQTWMERLQTARDNLQVNAQLHNFQLRMEDDFYSALLKFGFAALTFATEAVFLNEGRKIGVGRWTWLEEDRLKEVEKQRQPVESLFGDTVAEGVGVTDERANLPLDDRDSWKSGYSRERTTKTLKSKSEATHPRTGDGGVGMVQRGGRYLMAWELFHGILRLSVRWFLVVLSKCLGAAGISWRPGLLRSKLKDKTQPKKSDALSGPTSSLDFWLLSDDGNLSLPQDDDVDVERETKKRLQMVSERWGPEEERKLDSTLYGWWTHGGWWGERDDSGPYDALSGNDDDDDTTSMVSTTTAEETDWESDDSGARTPTQRHPFSRHSLSPSPDPAGDHIIDSAQLSRLLNPKDAEARQEARMLAAHLSSDHILTRSQYNHAETIDKTRLLTSTRHRPPGFVPSLPNGRLTPAEEAEILEYLILSRRTSSAQPGESWGNGAEGLGAGGPQCVVCQSAPRTILAWPCRCLSLCEECRVSLAMNNFATCVCCRTDVVGFSRLFVP